MISGDAGDGSGLGVAMQKNHGTVFLAASSMTQLSRPHFSAVRDPPVAARAELQSRLASYPAT